ncbi:MAG TPA: RDD family protein [Acidimicrobiales bacterium]
MSALGYEPPRDPTAVMGRRTGAFVVDSLIILVPTALVASAEFEYLEENERGEIEVTGGALEPNDFCDRYNDEVGAFCFSAADRVYFTEGLSPAPSLTALGLAIVLMVVLHGVRGLTPGKALFGIRTVGEDGRPPGIGRALARWLMWIVDGAPWCLPLVGPITALSSVGHRRVGDMAAKTLVIRKEDAGHPVAVPGLESTAAGFGPGEPVGAGPAGYPPPPGAGSAYPPPADGRAYTAPPGTPSAPPGGAGPYPPPGGTAPSAQPGASTAYPPPGGATAYPPPGGSAPSPGPGGGTDQSWGPRGGADRQPGPGGGPDQPATPPGSADRQPGRGGGPDQRATPAPPTEQPRTGAGGERPTGGAGAAEPAGPASGDEAWYRPQWDPARGTYIVWDPRRSQWLGWDLHRQEWRPL